MKQCPIYSCSHHWLIMRKYVEKHLLGQSFGDIREFAFE